MVGVVGVAEGPDEQQHIGGHKVDEHARIGGVAAADSELASSGSSSIKPPMTSSRRG